jgi:hypothetical protein
MSTCVYQQEIYPELLTREYLIDRIRAMLNSAERGDMDVALEFGSLSLHIDFNDNELYLIA